MSKYKYSWKSIEELKQEEWELNVTVQGVIERFKCFIADNSALAESDNKDVTLFLNIANESTRYRDLLTRLKEDLGSIMEEIKEREDEENQTKTDNL